MIPYWTQNFVIDSENHEVNLYNYSSKCIVLASDATFGKSFAKEFKAIGGKYNSKLKFSEDQNPQGGWIFRATEESQNSLTNLLKDIFNGNVKPNIFKLKEPIFDQQVVAKKIINKLNELVELCSEEEENIQIDAPEVTLDLSFNQSYQEEENCIYKLETSKKTLYVYQNQK